MKGRLSWRRLSTLLAHLPPRESALVRAVHGDAVVDWTAEVEQLSQVKHALNMANWQRGGGKGSRPKPDRRPNAKNEIHIGGTTRPQDEVRRLLDSMSYNPDEETVADAER